MEGRNKSQNFRTLGHSESHGVTGMMLPPVRRDFSPRVSPKGKELSPRMNIRRFSHEKKHWGRNYDMKSVDNPKLALFKEGSGDRTQKYIEKTNLKNRQKEAVNFLSSKMISSVSRQSRLQSLQSIDKRINGLNINYLSRYSLESVDELPHLNN